MSWFVDKIKKKKNNKTFLISFSANNLVGFGSEWTLKLSVRCKFESDRNLDQSLLPISSSSVYLLST
jgi:hypothetical protein